MENRKIVHIDMDAFFASVEQRDKPEYRAMPVIVGGAPDKRGVVAACSYEARKYGIRSAMSSARASRLCPQAIFLRPRFEAYRQVSADIQTIFKTFTNLVEPLSLDEAYLDVSACTQYGGSATRIAEAIKSMIKQATDLTASAGVSYNKFLAKIASDMDKPDGLYVITPAQGQAFIENLAIGKFYGIGKATEAKMQVLGIHNGADLKRWKRQDLTARFGKAGNYYYDIARGIDHRPVINTRLRKSLGSETTFENDLADKDDMLASLQELAQKVLRGLQAKQLLARTVTIKVKYEDFALVTRRITLEQPFNDMRTLLPILPQLLNKTDVAQRRVRLLGVSVSNLMKDDELNGYDQIALL